MEGKNFQIRLKNKREEEKKKKSFFFFFCFSMYQGSWQAAKQNSVIKGNGPKHKY
jgi:hypothetical protein